MRNYIIVTSVTVCVLAISSSASQEAPAADSVKTCAVSGRVRNIQTGEPLNNATVRLEPVDAEATQKAFRAYRFGTRPRIKARYATFSDSHGSFCFETVSAGQYRLSGSKRGLLETTYGALSPTEPGKSIAVGKESLSSLDVGLVPQGVITGRLLDSDREPVSNAAVKLLKGVWISGALRNVPVLSSSSNDLGEFRLVNVLPGTYYLLVEPRERNELLPEGALAGRSVLLRTFAPGVLRATNASTIVVHSGEEVNGVTITLLRGPTYRISGRLDGVSAPGEGTVMISPDDEEVTALVVASSSLKPDGTFEFKNLAPGSYTLRYVTVAGASFSGGRVRVEVIDRDIEGARLPVYPPAVLRGRVRLMDENAKELGGGASFSGYNLRLITADALMGPEFPGTVTPDGTFVINNITPGRYTVRASGPAGTFLQNVWLAERDITDQDLDLTFGGGGNIVLVFRQGSANIEGTVERSQGTGDGGVTTLSYVALVPANPHMIGPDGDGIALAQCDESGRFSLKTVQPGTYHALAFESIDFSLLLNPATAKALEALGSVEEVKAGDQKSIKLRMASVDDIKRSLAGANALQ